jgi:hypothetical protein
MKVIRFFISLFVLVSFNIKEVASFLDKKEPSTQPTASPTFGCFDAVDLVALLGGIASDGGAVNLDGEDAAQAFDGLIDPIIRPPPSSWLILANSGTLAFEFPSSQIVDGYSITVGAFSERDPRTWTLQGSNDNINFDDLDFQQNIVFSTRSETLLFFPNTGFYTKRYKTYRLVITNNGGTLTQVAEVIFYTVDSIHCNQLQNLVLWIGGIANDDAFNPFSTQNPGQAFDGFTDSKWFAATTTPDLDFEFF